jgi:hypothetical protein
MNKITIKDPRGRPRNEECEELVNQIFDRVSLDALPHYIDCDEKMEKKLRNSTSYKELNKSTGNSIRLFRRGDQLLVSRKGN